MTATTPTPEALIARLKAMGLEPRDYSGRGMYGRECVAVSIDCEPGDYEFPRGWSQDQLGRGIIVYWPSVLWPGGSEGRL